MKANELMIGDWVCVNGLNAQVFELAYNQTEKELTTGILDTQGEVYYCYEGYDHVEPIPLTTEILENNGFDISDGEVMRYNFEEDGQSYHFSLRQMYNQKDNKPNGYSFYAFNVLTIIDYVHELQHALKLCGIEKEIQL